MNPPVPLNEEEIAEMEERLAIATQTIPTEGDPFVEGTASSEWVKAYYGSKAASFDLHIEHKETLGRCLATIRERDAQVSELQSAIRKLGGSSCEDGACHFCGKRYGHMLMCSYAELKELAVVRPLDGPPKGE